MDGIIAFLRNSALGRPMYTDELVYSLENDVLEGVYTEATLKFGFLNP